MVAVVTPPEQKVILHGVSWRFYEQMQSELGDTNAAHLAYDNGTLEITVPTFIHERPNRILADLVTTICVELGIDACNAGSTTFDREDLLKGCEPDTAFYIQNEPRIRGHLEIDLETDPPPDLVIEIDITHPSLDKLPIYAGLGVPEIWRSDGESVSFYRLRGNAYEETEYSLALPILTSEITEDFLQRGLNESLSVWFRQVREWINSLQS